MYSASRVSTDLTSQPPASGVNHTSSSEGMQDASAKRVAFEKTDVGTLYKHDTDLGRNRVMMADRMKG
jgi:hypothetical protein